MANGLHKSGNSSSRCETRFRGRENGWLNEKPGFTLWTRVYKWESWFLMGNLISRRKLWFLDSWFLVITQMPWLADRWVDEQEDGQMEITTSMRQKKIRSIIISMVICVSFIMVEHQLNFKLTWPKTLTWADLINRQTDELRVATPIIHKFLNNGNLYFVLSFIKIWHQLH